MVARDRQNINGIRLNVWRQRILQERFARNRSIITTWANFEATGKLFTLSWRPLRIIAELSAAMWNAAVIYSAWQRIVQSTADKLNSVTEKKKKSQHSRKLLFRRTIRGKINRSRDDPWLPPICRFERHFRHFDASSFIIVVFNDFFFSFWNIYPWIFDLSRSLKLRSTNGRLTYLPWKEVFQKGWLRSRRMRKDLFQVSRFWKILRDWEKEREISGNDYQELERSFGYSGILSEDTKFKWLYKAKKLWRSQS